MTNYRDAGVNIDAKMTALESVGAAVKATHSNAVLAGLGAFGGCFDLQNSLAEYKHPVLVASTDGVGTKTMVAAAVGRFDGLGADVVNHCINDILCQGAAPLFFLDYLAAATLEPDQIVAIVQSIASACQAAGIALLGGETAEMPGVYQTGAFDLAGTIIGVVDRSQLLDGSAINADDVILALPASGLHTNGYSLARKLCAPHGYAATPAALAGMSLGEALLAPHRAYHREILALRAGSVPIHGLVHITGGGIWDNLPRVVGAQWSAELIRDSWAVPPICQFLVAEGQLDEREAYRVFNMGLGMLVIVPGSAVVGARSLVPELREVGRIAARAADSAQPRVRLLDAST